ncbi:MAG: hypothetical protein PHG18_01920 [Bacilli bacterium]|nr:hypothetical protein [Bacilli bacterium]
MEITLQKQFANATDLIDLLDRLRKYEEKGIRIVHTYGYKSIKMEFLISRIETLSKQGYDLVEIYKQICYEIN